MLPQTGLFMGSRHYHITLMTFQFIVLLIWQLCDMPEACSTSCRTLEKNRVETAEIGRCISGGATCMSGSIQNIFKGTQVMYFAKT